MAETQDLHLWLANYEATYPDDVLVIDEPVGDEDIAALVWDLAGAGRAEVLRFTKIEGKNVDVVTNVFASRRRVERILGSEPSDLHRVFQVRAANRQPLREADGPVTENVRSGADVDLTQLPLIRHFESDLDTYITSGIIVAEDPDTGIGNLSYHRATVSSPHDLATSLHSRNDLWRMLQAAETRGEVLPVAMVIGGHPLFMLAASARVPATVDEREVAGGLFGVPLEVVRTPRYGIAVPATADVVLEGVIDPAVRSDEGPFGEFSGYSSDRSTNNAISVKTILSRADAIWLDVVGGNSDEHLNLARIPREAEMADKLMDRFPSVTRLHYPNSGTHFHAYVALRPQRIGEARQVLLALLGWDPYLKLAVAVDDDIDVAEDGQVLWALATHFQPADDVVILDGLPGSALDPSSSAAGTTSRMALDATRGPGFEGTRIQMSEQARRWARRFVDSASATKRSVRM